MEKFGLRNPPLPVARILIIFIYKRLCSIPTTIVPNDFYDKKTLLKKARMEQGGLLHEDYIKES